MRITINVGLTPGFHARQAYQRGITEWNRILCVAEWARYTINGVVLIELHSGPEEGCVVVSGDYGGEVGELRAKLFSLAVETQQDCIAAVIEGISGGILVGPHPAAWWPFDESKFIYPKGDKP